jgi:hypothetical protein
MIAHRRTASYVDPRPDTKIGMVRTELMGLLDGHRRDAAHRLRCAFCSTNC